MKPAIVLYTSRPNADGTYPLYLRITHDRKPRYARVLINRRPIDLTEKQWDKKAKRVKAHPNAAYYNAGLSKIMADADALIATTPGITAEMLFARLFTGAAEKTDFLSLYKAYGDGQASGFTVNAYKKYVRKLQAWLNGGTLYVEDITIDTIKSFHGWLKKQRKVNGQPLAATTIHAHMKSFRAVYDTAVPRRLDRNVFNYYTWDKGRSKKKPPLQLPEVDRIMAVQLDQGGKMWHARNVIVTSLRLHGMRISDVLQARWEMISQGRLNYTMQKTNVEKAPLIDGVVEAILMAYGWPHKKHGYIFPYLQEDFVQLKKKDKEKAAKILESATTFINYHLRLIGIKAGITTPLSTHTARNTVADTLRRKGVNTALISDVIGHKDEATTKHYLEDWETEAMDDATKDLFQLPPR